MNETTDPRITEAMARNAHLGGSRWIEYGGMMIMAPLRDINDAVTSLKTGDRRKIMASVSASLAGDFPRVKAEKASQKQAMRCAQDIAIWFANEVVEGRATLECN